MSLRFGISIIAAICIGAMRSFSKHARARGGSMQIVGFILWASLQLVSVSMRDLNIFICKYILDGNQAVSQFQ